MLMIVLLILHWMHAIQHYINAQMSAADIDFILVATSTPDRISPGLAPELGYLLGAKCPGAIDINGACTGFLYGLDFATSRIENGRSSNVLVVGADAMTRLTNKNDRNTVVLFGDGAGAVVVSIDSKKVALRPSFCFGSAGEFADDLLITRKLDTSRCMVERSMITLLQVWRAPFEPC